MEHCDEAEIKQQVIFLGPARGEYYFEGVLVGEASCSGEENVLRPLRQEPEYHEVHGTNIKLYALKPKTYANSQETELTYLACVTCWEPETKSITSIQLHPCTNLKDVERRLGYSIAARRLYEKLQYNYRKSVTCLPSSVCVIQDFGN